MIGVNITTKNGLLLLSHFFVPGFSDVDEDLRAGLMTAVLNAVKETQNDTGIKTINQGKYYVHILEGEHTYGIFFSHEHDLKERNFATITVRRFENTFRKELEDELGFDDDTFADFQEFLKKEYNTLISIDVVGLSKIIDIMENSLFNDYILLEKPNFHQVFTTISLPDIHPHANTLAQMCKTLVEESIMIGQEIEQLQFTLGRDYMVFVDRFRKYVVIIIIMKKNREKALKEIIRLKNKISNVL
ncbi:MAG: hypothetical protein ACW99F_03595 [Candidatus Hodarchaeales archaeon]|jgi:hypothetical protein